MSTLPDTPWVIELTAPQFSKPMQFELQETLVIGRRHPNNPQQPEVDLSNYGAEEQGVSRLHVSIRCEDDRLLVTDLESGNGTFLNGNRLTPNEPVLLHDGDHLKLGNFQLGIKVIISPAYGGEMHTQPDLELHDEKSPGSGQLVLIIEDDPGVAKIFSVILEKAGFKTMICPEVVAAIRIFNQKRPSAIVLDVMLPGMSGLELCRYVRRDAQASTTPIIVVSAAKTPPRVTEAMQAGADIFLSKPVSAPELRHVVASLISQYEQHSSVSIHTRHLVGTAPLQSVQPESRRDSAVLFVAGYSNDPLVVHVRQVVTFGRQASTGDLSKKPHIDLSRFDAINLGVSRKHIRLHNEEGHFWVEDLDSANGTYVNGNALKPNEKVLINNSDEIRLGRLRMYIYFLDDTNITQDEVQDE